MHEKSEWRPRGVFVQMYLVEIAGRIEPMIGGLGSLSQFDYLDTTPVASGGVLDVPDLTVLGAVGLLT